MQGSPSQERGSNRWGNTSQKTRLPQISHQQSVEVGVPCQGLFNFYPWKGVYWFKPTLNLVQVCCQIKILYINQLNAASSPIFEQEVVIAYCLFSLPNKALSWLLSIRNCFSEKGDYQSSEKVEVGLASYRKQGAKTRTVQIFLDGSVPFFCGVYQSFWRQAGTCKE